MLCNICADLKHNTVACFFIFQYETSHTESVVKANTAVRNFIESTNNYTHIKIHVKQSMRVVLVEGLNTEIRNYM